MPLPEIVRNFRMSGIGDGNPSESHRSERVRHVDHRDAGVTGDIRDVVVNRDLMRFSVDIEIDQQLWFDGVETSIKRIISVCATIAMSPGRSLTSPEE